MLNNFFPENRTIWKRRAATNENIRPMRVTWRLSKTTDKHLEYVLLPARPRQQSLHERISLLGCVTFILKDITT
jgi:hypothetical protein